MPDIPALAIFSGVEDRKCLCFSASPPAALPGMRHSRVGSLAPFLQILLVFLSPQLCGLMGLGPPATYQEATPNFPLMQQQGAG